MKTLVYTPFRVGSSYICESLKDENVKKVTFFNELKVKENQSDSFLIKDHTSQERTDFLKKKGFDLIVTCLRKPTDIFISAYIKDFREDGYPYSLGRSEFSVKELVDHFLSFEWEDFEWLSIKRNLDQIREISGVDFNKEEFDKKKGYNLIDRTLLLTHDFVFNRKEEYHNLINELKPVDKSKYQFYSFSNYDTDKDLYNDFKKAIPKEFFEKYKHLDEEFDNKFGRDIQREILDVTICENEFGKYCVPNNTIQEGVGRIVKKGVVYEGCTVRFIRDNCEGKDVIHAGSFFGDMLPALSEKANHLWAFEPVKENFRCSQITKILNDLKNVTLVNCALGSENQKSKIQIKRLSGESLGGCCSIERRVKKAEAESIKIIRLDDFLKTTNSKEVSIIHLDIEGFEEKALKGSLETIQSSYPILILEAIEDQKYNESLILESKWFKENIFTLGYELADFDGVMGDSGYKGRVHGNVVLCHPKNPWKKYFNQKNELT